MIVCGQNFSQDILEQIQSTVTGQPDISRRQLSRKICQLLDWRSPNGNLKEMSCRVALLKLHRQDIINLPEVNKKPNIKYHRNPLNFEHEEIPQIEYRLSEFGQIKIIQIKKGDFKKSHIWNELLNRYHYLGSGPLCGAQIRYLIENEKYGFIGGFSFSSAAWRLNDRDKFIGWDEQARKKHLDKVVCNSRFLIVPHVKVKNLASYVLSMCVKRLSKDWYERYRIKPILLETFVERDRFDGISYRASNWKHIGITKGRGRQDFSSSYSKSVKDIYIYELNKNYKEILCEGRERKESKDKIPVDWAEEEFSHAKLGDKRRVNRLLRIARDFYANPEANIPQACGSRAKTKAAYRFFDEPENSMQKILAPHIKSTWNRIRQEKIILSIQDTTFLNYSTHPATENLGPIRNRGDGCIGLLVHDTMAFNLEGTPLGLLDVRAWARDPEKIGQKHLRANLPIEQKESNKWLKSFQATQKAQEHSPDTVIVSVGDRESDIYELFALALSSKEHPKLLVRAEKNRLLADGQTHLWDYLSNQPLSGIRELEIPRRGKRAGREAKLEIRFTKVRLKAPKQKKGLKELEVWAILAEETNCPEVKDPLKWMLITTIDVNSFEDAVEKLDWYALRYWIEVYHRTLKSGCKIEHRQLGNADRIESCLSIDMVVAWRIFHLTKLGRETPNVDCTVYFEDAQWKALIAYKTQNPIPPENPPSLREAIHTLASLGGFLGRKGDGEPGTKSLWLGLQRLDDITEMWGTCISFFAPEYMRPPPVSS